MGDPPDCLWGKMNHTRHRGRGVSLAQWLQGNGPEHHPNLLNARPQNPLHGLLVLLGKCELDGAS